MTKRIFTNKQILKLLDYYQSIWALDHLNKLAAWDSEVYMPVQGAKYRGKALAKTQIIGQAIFLDKKFRDIIKSCEEEDLNIFESAVLRLVKRELKYYEKLPSKFLEEFEETISEAQIVWRKSRSTNSFETFQPFLVKIVRLSREKAKYLGYQAHPYDALLDIYEEGTTVKTLDPYFDGVIEGINELLTYIKSSKYYAQPNQISKISYDLDKAAELNTTLLKFLQYDSRKLRLDTSTHPFSEGLSTDDARITTRYEGKDIVKTVTSTTHEFGHALYFLQHSNDLNTTPLYTNCSLAIHESQSRFFENQIGRNFEFIEQNLAHFHNLGEEFSKFSPEDFYRYFNTVKPSLIRVEADEVTYHAHIYIRYEIEKSLIEGELEAKDVPTAWDDMYEKLLGVRSKTFSNGCLQDIHWSMGAIGYFPTYSMGTVFAAQVANKMTLEIGNISDLIKTSEGILKIESWLMDNIHQYGAVYTLEELSRKLTETGLDTKHWKKYLFEKYKNIY